MPGGPHGPPGIFVCINWENDVTATLNPRLLMVGILMGSALLWPLQSGAEESGQATHSPEAGSMLVLGSSPLSADVLDMYRGGTEVHVANDNTVDGNVYGNQASNLTTGTNLINEGSFAGANGVSTVIQNSGNNVLIQNSTIVNLQVQ